MAMFYINNQLVGVTGKSCDNVIIQRKSGEVFKGLVGKCKDDDKSVKVEIEELKKRVKELEDLLGYK